MPRIYLQDLISFLDLAFADYAIFPGLSFEASFTRDTLFPQSMAELMFWAESMFWWPGK